MRRKNEILAEAVLNVFCPTGPGGGIKPNCSVKSGGAAAPASKAPMDPLSLDKAMSKAKKGQAVTLERVGRDGQVKTIKGTVESVRKVKTMAGMKVESVAVKHSGGQTHVKFGDTDVVSFG
jgi:hypothetical protein